jgi:O-antigen/teichoic acid export membrane protein
MSIAESKKETIKSGVLALTGNLLGKFVSLPVGIYIASVLSPSGFGLLAFVSVIIQYIGFLNFGMLSNITREVPIAYGKNNIDEVKTVYNTVFTNYLITTLVGIIVLWILNLVELNYDGQLSTLHFVIMSFIVLTANAESFFYSYIKGEGKFIIFGQYELVSKIVVPLFTVVLVYFFAFTGMLISLIFTHILGLGFILYKIKLPKLRFRLNLGKTKELFSTGILMYFNKIIDVFFISIVIILAAKFMISSAVGTLSFALGFAEVSKIPFATILTVTIDRRMAYEGGKFGEIKYHNYAKFFGSTYVIYLLLLSMFLGIFVIFYMITVNIFLQKYVLAIPILIILFFALNFYNARYFMNSYINVTRQMNKRSVILIVGVLINIVFGYLSIKLGFGIIGLASVTAFSMIVISVQTIFIVFRQVYGNTIKVYSFLFKILVISGISTALLFFFKDFTFTNYEYDYHDILQMFFAILDLFIKCIVYIVSVFLLFIAFFRNENVYTEIKTLLDYTVSKIGFLFKNKTKSIY